MLPIRCLSVCAGIEAFTVAAWFAAFGAGRAPCQELLMPVHNSWDTQSLEQIVHIMCMFWPRRLFPPAAFIHC